MTFMRLIKLTAALAMGAGESLLFLHWMTPSATQWRQIDAMYAAAERRHEFICVYTPLGDLIRATRFDAWLHAPITLHVLLAVLLVPLLIVVAAELAAPTFQPGRRS
jgi:hypothetical protein